MNNTNERNLSNKESFYEDFKKRYPDKKIPLDDGNEITVNYYENGLVHIKHSNGYEQWHIHDETWGILMSMTSDGKFECYRPDKKVFAVRDFIPISK